MPSSDPISVILLSGGLDSATTLAIARDAGYQCHALSFDYGQRHQFELASAKNIANHFGTLSHRIVQIDPTLFAGSALTDDIEVPKDRSSNEMSSGIPVTYVPARNTIFLSYALALAETTGAEAIHLGINAVDYSGYPDCRPEYLAAFQQMAQLATQVGVEQTRPIEIYAPLLHLTKQAIIQRGLELGVDYSMTHSCYDPNPNGDPCQHCDACQLRISAFESIGQTDPTLPTSH